MNYQGYSFEKHIKGNIICGMEIHSTTVIGIVKDGKAAIGSDGQVTFGDTVLKHTASKVRTLWQGNILAGFAGSVADALTLFERLEEKLEDAKGNLLKASVELAKDWRQDKVLRRLEALLAVVDKKHAFVISGTGDLIESDDGIVAVGSGAPYALAAARALMKHTKLPPYEIVKESLKIASEICIYTNSHFTILKVD